MFFVMDKIDRSHYHGIGKLLSLKVTMTSGIMPLVTKSSLSKIRAAKVSLWGGLAAAGNLRWIGGALTQLPWTGLVAREDYCCGQSRTHCKIHCCVRDTNLSQN
jgi:hypothetical protein